MNHINKLHERDEALQILGARKYATKEEIRAAWKRIASTTHPDLEGGSAEKFGQARCAYELLCDLSERYPRPQVQKPKTDLGRTASVGFGIAAKLKRPRVVTRIVDVTIDAEAQCKALLGEKDDAADRDAKTDNLNAEVCENDAAASVAEVDPKDHVPQAIRRRGRRLSYIVTTPLGKGANRVALPTGELTHKSKVDPKMVNIESPTEGSGTYEVPEKVRSHLFPGANQVRIHFAEAK